MIVLRSLYSSTVGIVSTPYEFSLIVNVHGHTFSQDAYCQGDIVTLELCRHIDALSLTLAGEMSTRDADVPWLL